MAQSLPFERLKEPIDYPSQNNAKEQHHDAQCEDVERGKMKPKTKELLFDTFAVTCVFAGYSIHGWPSLVFLLVGSFCAAFALYFILLNHRVHGVTKSQARNWGWIMFVVSSLGASMYWREYKQPAKQITAAPSPAPAVDWRPPELPKGCTHFQVLIGGSGMGTSYGTAGFTNGPVGPQTALMRVGTTVIGRLQPKYFIKDNRLYVQMPFPIGGEGGTISPLYDDPDKAMPMFLDRNYNSDAFEIIGEDKLPVLQVIYKRPEIIEVNGIFAASNGVFILFDGANPRIQSEIPADLPSRKALFRYPASLHLHELAP